MLENGVAYFNETLVMPATLYFDKKRKRFIDKEVKYHLSSDAIIQKCQASIVLTAITNRGTKIIGITKIDLASYPNLKIAGNFHILWILSRPSLPEKTDAIPIMRSVDKNAKYCCTIRILQMKELEAEHAHLYDRFYQD